MARIFAPIVPPSDPRFCAPWLNRELRRISTALQQQGRSLAAVARGESPDGGGGDLTDTSKFFYKPGRLGGQLGYGGQSPSENLIWSSTASGTKGKIYLGSALGSAYDEANNVLGIGTAAPTSGIHVKANPQPASTTNVVFPTSTLLSFTTPPLSLFWDSSNLANPHLELDEFPNDGDISQINASGVAPYDTTARFGFSITVVAGSTWTLDVAYAKTSAATNGSLIYSIVDSTGQQWDAPAVSLSGISTGYLAVSLTSWTAGATGQTPNSCAVRVNATSGPGSPRIKTSNIRLTQVTTSTSAVAAVARFDTSAATTLKNTEWRDASAGVGSEVVVASVNSSGQGQFQNIALEDPGSGTNTITLKAPTSPTSHSLVWPSVPIDTAFLKVAYSGTTGTLSWVVLSASSFPHVILDSTVHTDTLTGTVVQGDLIVGNSTPKWSRLPRGSALNILHMNAAGTDPEWASVSTVVLTQPYTAVTGTYSITTTDYTVDCTSGTFTVTLPTAVGVTGRIYVIKNSGTGTITVATTGGQTIDGGSTASLIVQYVSITVVSDGANWKVT